MSRRADSEMVKEMLEKAAPCLTDKGTMFHSNGAEGGAGGFHRFTGDFSGYTGEDAGQFSDFFEQMFGQARQARAARASGP